jgi:hypothetical protein
MRGCEWGSGSMEPASQFTKAKYDYAAEAFRDRFGSLAGAAHQFLFVENMTSYRKKNLKKYYKSLKNIKHHQIKI